jgi:hypothetical protein
MVCALEKWKKKCFLKSAVGDVLLGVIYTITLAGIAKAIFVHHFPNLQHA